MIHPSSDVQTQHIGKGTSVWQFCVILKGAVIGRDCNINAQVFIENDVILGDRVTVKSGVQLWDGLRIEDDVFIGPNATFTNDLRPRSKQYPQAFPQTIIQQKATIGANATILPGITIGAFSMVGAGSVVTKDVPERALVVGNPACIIDWLNEDGTRMMKENGLLKDNLSRLWQEHNGELIPYG